MKVKDAMDIFFNYMYGDSSEDYPITAWSPYIDEKIYIGGKENGWIKWKPLVKDVVHDFNIVEGELGIKIHEDIKEYFNSYWFLYLSVPYGKYNFILHCVAPGEEFKNILEQWRNCLQYFEKDIYLVLGYDSNNECNLIINNTTGKICLFDRRSSKIKKTAFNLGEFIYNPIKAIMKK